MIYKNKNLYKLKERKLIKLLILCVKNNIVFGNKRFNCNKQSGLDTLENISLNKLFYSKKQENKNTPGTFLL